MVNEYGQAVWDHHAQALAASGIAVEVARRARGYRSISTKAELGRLGFTSGQQNTPGLLVPIRDETGQIATYQYRPDEPRVNPRTGKTAKYLNPPKTPMVADVPPAAADRLGDPNVPLWVTEGAKKADAAVTFGLCCIALLGVANWRGTNDKGGKTALAFWDSVALNGRTVYVAYDSDVMRKRQVHDQLARIGGFLAHRGAEVAYVYMPSADGAKVGLDDYLAGGGSVSELVNTARAEPIEPARGESDATRAPSSPGTSPAHLHTPPSEPPARAYDQRILDAMVCTLRDAHRLTGEHRNAQLVYFGLTSRLLDDPVSLAIKGPSSSGKSHTVDKVLAFFPEEAVIVMTAMSEHALVYMEEEFTHRTIVLFEATALAEQREKAESNMTAYFVRSLLSEGRIRYPVTAKDDSGGLATRWIVKQGPTNMVLTTTATSLHDENETRMLSLPTDDSPEQTEAVFRAIAHEDTAGEPDTSDWHQLQRWLAGRDNRVTIPYAAYLAENIPPVAVRLRRDFGTVLALIRAHAALHQATRDRDSRGRIIATVDDYAVVRELVLDLLAEGVEATVSTATRETVNMVAELAPHAADDDSPAGVTVRAVASALDLDRSATSRRVKVAREAGYLVNLEDRRGRPGRYRIGDPLPAERELLPDVQAVQGVHTGVCTVEEDETAGHTGESGGVCTSAGTAAGEMDAPSPHRVLATCVACGEVDTCHRDGDGSPVCLDCRETGAA